MRENPQHGEKVDGRVLLTENVAVSGYGGKMAVPPEIVKPGNVELSGSLKLFNTNEKISEDDVVPDLTFTKTYGI